MKADEIESDEERTKEKKVTKELVRERNKQISDELFKSGCESEFSIWLIKSNNNIDHNVNTERILLLIFFLFLQIT